MEMVSARVSFSTKTNAVVHNNAYNQNNTGIKFLKTVNSAFSTNFNEFIKYLNIGRESSCDYFFEVVVFIRNLHLIYFLFHFIVNVNIC